MRLRRLHGYFTEEPLWVDLRWARGEELLSPRDPRFRERVADLAPPLYGQPKDELIGQGAGGQRTAVAAGGTVAVDRRSPRGRRPAARKRSGPCLFVPCERAPPACRKRFGRGGLDVRARREPGWRPLTLRPSLRSPSRTTPAGRPRRAGAGRWWSRTRAARFTARSRPFRRSRPRGLRTRGIGDPGRKRNGLHCWLCRGQRPLSSPSHLAVLT
jgi:hypothetical protein